MLFKRVLRQNIRFKIKMHIYLCISSKKENYIIYLIYKNKSRYNLNNCLNNLIIYILN